MKLTAASLAAQSADAFDGSPEVSGELEGYVRYVLSKDGNILLVADTKTDPEGGDKAKLARFTWDKLPDGCGKGAKVKLSGIKFERKVGRDYNGKTYYDMVYSFTACEVLEAGAPRQGGGYGKGGGWSGGRAPMTPEERASIEAQSITSSAAVIVAGQLRERAMEAADAAAYYGVVFDAMWAKVQKAKASVPRQPQEPASASQQQAAPATAGSGTAPKPTQPAKTQPAKPHHSDDDPQSIYEAVRSTRSEVEAFRKAIGNAIGVFVEGSVDAAIARAGTALYGDAYGAKGIEFLSDAAQAAIIKLLREE